MPKELKPWYAVATPHEDIQKGRLSEAVFAANLWAVVQGTAPEVYTDPDAFSGNLSDYPPDKRRGCAVVSPAGFMEHWRKLPNA